MNKGNFNFETKALPKEAQFTSYKDAVVVNANGDDKPDILLMGNYYGSNIEMGRYDADFGTLLINRGKGNFVCSSLNGLVVKEQVRHIQPIKINHQQTYILARNNDSAMVIKIRPGPPKSSRWEDFSAHKASFSAILKVLNVSSTLRTFYFFNDF